MSFVHSKSQECSKSKLDLFSVPPTQTSLEKGHWVEHQPVSSVAEMQDPSLSWSWVPKTMWIYQKADGADLDADEKVGIVNNFLQSLFKQVDVFPKEKQVTQATSTYAYCAYLVTLLNYGPAAKDSQLTASMFYKDKAGKMDVADPTIGTRC